MSKPITVLVFPVGAPPEVRDIDPGLESMQAVVGGYIQLVPLCGGPLEVCCNEEGKLDELPYNRHFGDDILCGQFFVTKTGRSGNAQSLTAADVADATAYFRGLEVAA